MVDPDDYSSLFCAVIAWKSSDCVSGVLKCAWKQLFLYPNNYPYGLHLVTSKDELSAEGSI